MSNEELELIALCDAIIAQATPEQIAEAEQIDLADLFALADEIGYED